MANTIALREHDRILALAPAFPGLSLLHELALVLIAAAAFLLAKEGGPVLSVRYEMIHPATELRHINDVIGYGVFATAFIPAGTITWVRDDLDQTFTTEEAESLPPHYHPILDKYTFIDAAGRLVLCWDHARFINHSCEATCLTAGSDFEIAVRDLQAGEELTDDYGTLNLREDFICACGSARCRRIIRPDDLVRHAASWDAKVEPLFRRMRELPQPLWPYVKKQDGVDGEAGNVAPYRSIRLNYHRQG